MGFYPPNVIVSEARRCDVEIRSIDAQTSDTVATADHGSIRLGLTMVNRLGVAGGEAVAEARGLGPFQSLADLMRRTRLGRQAIEALIWAGRWRRQTVRRLSCSNHRTSTPSSRRFRTRNEYGWK